LLDDGRCAETVLVFAVIGTLAMGFAADALVFALPGAWLAKDLDEQTIQVRLAERGKARMLEQMGEPEAEESAPVAGTSFAVTPALARS